MRRPSGPLIAGVSLAFSLIAVEAALKTFFPYPDPFAADKTKSVVNYIPSYYPEHFRMKTYVEEGLPGVQGTTAFSINNKGFRGDTLRDPKPADELRVFVVGGSTTECRVLDDSQDLCRVLQTELIQHFSGRSNIKVYNAGKSGDKTYDHVAMISQRIVHLQPDLIVLFAGINDLIASINGVDYLHYDAEQPEQQSLGPLLEYAATEFQIPRRVFAAINKFSHKSNRELFQEIEKRTKYRRLARGRKEMPVSNDPPRVDLAHYRENLSTIIGMAKANRVPLALMTQASTWNSKIDAAAADWHWMGLAFEKETYQEDKLDEALELYNDVMRRLAANSRVALLDLPKLMPKSLEFFYDDCHFNVKGAETTASLLADFLIHEGLVPRVIDYQGNHSNGPEGR